MKTEIHMKRAQCPSCHSEEEFIIERGTAACLGCGRQFTLGSWNLRHGLERALEKFQRYAQLTMVEG